MKEIKIFLISLFIIIPICLEAKNKQNEASRQFESIESILLNKKIFTNSQNPIYNYHLQNKVVVLIFQSGTFTEDVNNIFNILEPAFQGDSVSFVHIDIGELPEVFNFYNVTNIPYLLFFKNGVLEEATGILHINYIGRVVQFLLQDPEPEPEPKPEPEPEPEPTFVLENYVRTRIYQYMPGSQYLETVNYVDGLGRELLTISKGITPGKRDLVSLVEHDNMGRKYRTWLPGLLTDNGNSIHLDTLINALLASELHGQDRNPYSEIKYEPMSSEQVSKVFHPGEAWHSNNKSILSEYYLNSSSYPCPYYYLTSTGTSYIINKSGNYTSGKLYVTKTVDEDGNVSYEFKNKLQQLVMTRQVNGGKNHDTHFLYDKGGNLCAVLPPKAIRTLGADSSWEETNPNVRELCYLYKYDQRGRCIARKLPGVDWISNVYDCMDRVVMSQDGNLRKEKKWYYTVYDGLDRVVRSNIVTNATNLSRDSIQSLYNTWLESTYPLNENAQDINKPLHGNIFTICAKLQEIEYDNYESLPSIGELAFKPVQNIVIAADSQTKGLMTREKLYILDDKLESNTPNHVERVYYYDDKARVIQIVTKNKYKRISRESYKYDFPGNILARHEYHETSTDQIDSLIVTLEYDHASRAISSTAKLNNDSPTTIEYSYNTLGQMKTKKYGNGQNAINQTMQYNIRGWLEKQASNVFEIQLRYNTPLLAETKASYSGNITEWEWTQKTGQTDRTNTYVFSYDSLYRLSETRQYIAGNLNNQYVEKGIRYDENGNILSMQRTANGVLVDDLSYTYTGNRLTSLKESSRTSLAGDIYLPGSTPNGMYTYDENGNMITDSRKALKLEYNYLNLLRDVKTTSGVSKARYRYLSDGTKLEVRDNNEINGFDYLGSLTYKKSSAGLQLESASFGEGVIRTNTSNSVGNEVNYFLTDHQGSVRVIVDGNGVVKERNDYYSFGAKHARSDYPQLAVNRYKYNGKEEQVTGDLDYLDYNARMYDSGLGRWFGIDPHAENYYAWSPYAYVGNNPLKYTDPTGMDWYEDKDGRFIYDESIYSQKDLDKKKIEGKYLGQTYTRGDSYYSLFGDIMNLTMWEGKLFKKIDDVFIRYFEYSKAMDEFDSWMQDDPIEKSVNFDIGIKFSKNKLGLAEGNIHPFKFQGSNAFYFISEDLSKMNGIFELGDNKRKSNSTISSTSLGAGYNMYINKKGSSRSKIVIFVFPTLESKSKFHKKMQAEYERYK